MDRTRQLELLNEAIALLTNKRWTEEQNADAKEQAIELLQMLRSELSSDHLLVLGEKPLPELLEESKKRVEELEWPKTQEEVDRFLEALTTSEPSSDRWRRKKSRNGIAKVSVEILHHFQCDHCKRWWSIGDYTTPQHKQIYCPHCGLQNTIPDQFLTGKDFNSYL